MSFASEILSTTLLGEAVEAAKHLLRRRLDKIPRPDGALDRFEQRVLADPLEAAKDQAVIDLLVRALHPVGEESKGYGRLRLG